MKQPWKWSSLAVAAGVAIAGCLMLMSKPPRPPVLPVPNGYDDFVKAVAQVASEGRAYRDVTDVELRNLVEQNGEVLQSVRAACQGKCRVPMVYDRRYLSSHSLLLAGFKRLARAFWAEAVLAEREGRTNDAARVYVDGLRFGQESGRGGRIIDRLVGLSCEALLLPPLTNVVQNLDARTCRDLARILESMDKRSEPWQATVRQDRMWMRAVASPRERLLALWHKLQSRWKYGKWPDAQFKGRFDGIRASERGLMLDLARRAYELEHGRPSAHPDDLTSEYLKVIPRE